MIDLKIKVGHSDLYFMAIDFVLNLQNYLMYEHNSL